MDVAAYLRKHERKDLLRLLTCGSVDDGKSTLIGRLLYDSKMIYEDQLAAVKRDSVTHGTTGTDFDPALLTDGLKAEREQGITIDVAYRYFSTEKRKFIIADTPGHEQYTRNMATGASTSDLAIVLIDARNGVMTQTKRHSFIASLLGIKHIVVAINKMDLVGWSEDVLKKIIDDYNNFAAKLEIADIHFIPMSALKGDNVVDRSENMPWYQGAPLLPYLESVNIASDRNLIDLRFPVQYVLRPNLDFRGYCGTVASGIIRKGDEVMVLPSGQRSRVKSIVTFDGEVDEAFPPMAVTVTLQDERDVSRGDMLVHVQNVPHIGRDFEAMMVWMHEDTLKPGRPYLLKHATNSVPCEISCLRYKIDVNTLHRQKADDLQLNEIGRGAIHLHRPLAYDAYVRSKECGSFVIIDRLSNVTVGAGMILERDPNELVADRTPADEPKSEHIRTHKSNVTPAERRKKLGHEPATVWLTGLPKSGKSTIAYALEKRLFESGCLAHVLDGENMRLEVSRDLGFSANDRAENIRRSAGVARICNEAGLITIAAFVSPYAADRAKARKTVGSKRFVEVFVNTPLEICEARDQDKLYEKAREGEIPLFSGVSAPYEEPENPDLTLDAGHLSVEECVDAILAELHSRKLIG
ncbi:MAG: sulfate adenylyltransferase subunit CysN [Verrucomicrobia bacterium]|nr:sulfate adenylyltransferase subunit CysN [Verrucomicrobiota bacterium]